MSPGDLICLNGCAGWTGINLTPDSWRYTGNYFFVEGPSFGIVISATTFGLNTTRRPAYCLFPKDIGWVTEVNIKKDEA